MKKISVKAAMMTAKPDPIFEGMRVNLKDPKCFKKIEKKLAAIMESAHKHKSVKEFINCKECVDKRKKRQDTMKELGFNSYNQYLQWRRIHQIIAAKKDFQIR